MSSAYTCARCGVQSTNRYFRSPSTGHPTKYCYACRRRRDCRNFLDCLPEDLLSTVYEYAGGRPVHPSARVMALHIAETRNRLMHAPCFFESPGWDLTRMLCRHGWKKRKKDGLWIGSWRRTQKCTLPKRPRQHIEEPVAAAERIQRKPEVVCSPQQFILGNLH